MKYLLPQQRCMNRCQSGNEFGKHKHLGADIPIDDVFSKSKTDIKKKQDAKGIQNMPGVYFIGLVFYKMKAVINFMRWGGSTPPKPWVSAEAYRAQWVNKPVYKIKNK